MEWKSFTGAIGGESVELYVAEVAGIGEVVGCLLWAGSSPAPIWLPGVKGSWVMSAGESIPVVGSPSGPSPESVPVVGSIWEVRSPTWGLKPSDPPISVTVREADRDVFAKGGWSIVVEHGIGSLGPVLLSDLHPVSSASVRKGSGESVSDFSAFMELAKRLGWETAIDRDEAVVHVEFGPSLGAPAVGVVTFHQNGHQIGSLSAPWRSKKTDRAFPSISGPMDFVEWLNGSSTRLVGGVFSSIPDGGKGLALVNVGLVSFAFRDGVLESVNPYYPTAGTADTVGALYEAIRAGFPEPEPTEEPICTCRPGARDAHDPSCPVRKAHPRTDLGDRPLTPSAGSSSSTTDLGVFLATLDRCGWSWSETADPDGTIRIRHGAGDSCEARFDSKGRALSVSGGPMNGGALSELDRRIASVLEQAKAIAGGVPGRDPVAGEWWWASFPGTVDGGRMPSVTAIPVKIIRIPGTASTASSTLGLFEVHGARELPGIGSAVAFLERAFLSRPLAADEVARVLARPQDASPEPQEARGAPGSSETCPDLVAEIDSFCAMLKNACVGFQIEARKADHQTIELVAEGHSNVHGAHGTIAAFHFASGRLFRVNIGS